MRRVGGHLATGMDTVRYHVALLTLVTFIPGILFWPFAHGLVHSWRQLGLAISYSVLGAILIAIGAGVFLLRQPLLAVEFGSPGWLGFPALLCFVAALTIEVQCRRHLTLRTLVGIPELSPTPTGQPLLDQGIYARLRHPRYVVVMLSVFAVAFFTNYLAVYLLCPLACIVLYGITLMEERELVERFGQAYEQYQRRVPRFVPRISKG